MPYELHPRVPEVGLSLKERWGARYAEAEAMYARIESECVTAGLPFRRPERIPNTRRALETAECVRRDHPDAFPALDRALFAAHFVEGRFLGDPDVLDELVAGVGVDAGAVRATVESGTMRATVDESMRLADEIGVTGTPAWLLDGRLLLPGAQPRATIERIVVRMHSRT
ncbi:MAG: hypothetical protein E6G17_02685 [Actinobacteria bacterium]|nr:MAG: hypothetical protein E6G17_02685 [Actinomycetota bacterium]